MVSSSANESEGQEAELQRTHGLSEGAGDGQAVFSPSVNVGLGWSCDGSISDMLEGGELKDLRIRRGGRSRTSGRAGRKRLKQKVLYSKVEMGFRERLRDEVSKLLVERSWLISNIGDSATSWRAGGGGLLQSEDPMARVSASDRFRSVEKPADPLPLL